MKLVVDTNTLISGSLWSGPSAQLVVALLTGRAQLFLSLTLILELQEALEYPQFVQRLAGRSETPQSIAERFRAAAFEAVPARIVPPAVLRDADDAHVLACAVGAGADAIVTGDKDLLVLGNYQGIPIIDAAEALRRLNAAA